ncbi:hypothetical protein C7S14_2588 [Burkholderia cepacia]|nr:hypothetical protein C7S14_2588 [Burkholderia cepacia]
MWRARVWTIAVGGAAGDVRGRRERETREGDARRQRGKATREDNARRQREKTTREDNARRQREKTVPRAPPAAKAGRGRPRRVVARPDAGGLPIPVNPACRRAQATIKPPRGGVPRGGSGTRAGRIRRPVRAPT